MSTAFIIIGVTLWLGTMLVGLLLAANRAIVKLTRPLVCPRGTEMEVHTFRASYHHPGQRGIEIYAVGPGGRRDVKVRALWTLWGLCCLAALLPSALGVMLVVRWIASFPGTGD